VANQNLGDECKRAEVLAFYLPQFHPVPENDEWWGEGFIVGIDLQTRNDSSYFRQFVNTQPLADRIRSYWGIDQSDRETLTRIVADEFPNGLDLVFDDASHVAETTRASFEVLFPRLHPGGFYIIEDWAWLHWLNTLRPQVPNREAPTYLVHELVEALGSSPSPIAQLIAQQGFVAIERAPERCAEPFRLHDVISRRPELRLS
jgi:hypothetical protein